VTRTRPAIVFGVFLLALGLTACAPHPSPRPTATHLSPLEAADRAVATCMVGTWILDNSDFAEQNREWLDGLGLPIELYVTSGTATLVVTADQIRLHNATNTSAVVGGHSYNIGIDRTGSSAWSWSEDDEGVLTLTAWAWDSTDPTTGSPVRVGTFFDPTPGSQLEVTCDGPLLELHGPGTEITGRFDRAH
jgi:hypothetical protein